MSYILDALKKSDKERKRGAVPGISTVHGPPRPETTRRPVWPYVLLAVLLLNVGAMVWLLGIWKPADQNAGALQRSVQPAPAVTPPPTEGTSLADRSPAESGAGLQSRPEEGAPQKGAAAPGARAAQSPQPPQSSLHQKKGETTKEQKQAAPVPKDPGPRASDERSAASDATAERPSPPPIPPPQPNRIYAVSELPEALRQSLPPFAVSVALYSEDAASRMARINDQVVREGQQLSAGLRVEEITRDSIILSYQNYRFRVGLK